jgi:hypothetical protein
VSYIGNSALPFNPLATSGKPRDAQRFNGDNTTTTFTLNFRVDNATDLEVFVDNVQQEPLTAYDALANQLIFTEAPPSGTNNIYVVYRNTDSGIFANIPDGSITFNKLANNIRLFTTDNFTGDGGTATFTLSSDVPDANTLVVAVDGVFQRAPIHYTASNNTITFSSAPPVSSNVHVRHLGFRTTQTITALPANTTISQPTLQSLTATGTSFFADNVGIGTDTPTTKLDIRESAGSGTLRTILTLRTAESTTGTGCSLDFAQGSTVVGRVSSVFESGGQFGLAFSTFNINALSERMRITNAGNVLLGGSVTNNGRLTIKMPSATGEQDLIGIENAVSTGRLVRLSLNQTDDVLRLFNQAAGGAIAFGTANTERMRINNNGVLLIGQTTSGRVAGDNVEGVVIDPRSNQFSLQACSTNTPLELGLKNTGNIVNFYQNGAVVGTISVTATNTAYNTSSDYRLKEDWQPMSGAITRLNLLKPVNFAWKVDGSRVDGFLAHEAQEVVPECVTGTKDAVDKDGKPEYQGIDQGKLVPLLTAALQEAVAEINSLKARVEALESNQ